MTQPRSISVAQTCPVKGDVQAHLAEHLRLTQLAASEGAQIVVFPELSLTGYELSLAAIWHSRRMIRACLRFAKRRRHLQ